VFKVKRQTLTFRFSTYSYPNLNIYSITRQSDRIGKTTALHRSSAVARTCQMSLTSAQRCRSCRPSILKLVTRTALTERRSRGRTDGHFYRFVILISPREMTTKNLE